MTRTLLVPRFISLVFETEKLRNLTTTLFCREGHRREVTVGPQFFRLRNCPITTLFSSVFDSFDRHGEKA